MRAFISRAGIPQKETMILLIGVLLFSSPSCKHGNADNLERPNIVFIIGDDIGYADLGCYGSEISTPQLDRLAEEGARFRQFYNMAKCNPTRSSLHTGMFYGDSSSHSLGKLMGNAGYRTIFVGKEHYDSWVPDHCYAAEAFDESLTFWAMNDYFIQKNGTVRNPYFLQGKQVSPEQLNHSGSQWFQTDVITDYAIRFLEKWEGEGEDNPFFLYLSYLNAHYPLQALDKDISKYRGKYMDGWDIIRERRFQRQKDIGLVGDDWRLSAPSSNINRFRGHPEGNEEIRERIPHYYPWSSLNDSTKRAFDLEMAVFAALVDNMDQNISRLLNYLKKKGELENTIVMYMSDNGSCPYDSNKDFTIPPGKPNSFRTLNPKWANVGNTPFRYYKQYGHEGGANTHFIAWWPGKIPEGEIITQTGHVVDVLPTLLELADYSGTDSIKVDGNSLLPALLGGTMKEHPYLISGLDAFRMYREGNYKLVRVNYGDWQLFDLSSDPTEVLNLADSIPDKVKQLEDNYLGIMNK